VAGKRFYSDEEAEAILRLAAKKGAFGASMSHEQLLSAADELGISPEAVQEAEREYLASKQDEQDRLEYDRHVKQDFWGHLATYFIVNGGMAAFSIVKSGTLSWVWWPIIGWGIFIAFHAWETFAKSSEDYQKGLVKWRQKSRRSRKAPRVTVGVHIGRDVTSPEEAAAQAMRDIATMLDPSSQKVEAIRELRQRTGLGLKEAKEAVEQYNQQRG
jgi:hypothetical protein